MDIVVPRKVLIELLAPTVPISDKKSAMPALANVCLTAETSALGPGTLRVSATDLYLSATATAAAEVSKAGSVAIPAKDTLDRAKAMPEGPVQILATEGAQVTLKSVGAPRRYTLHGIPGSDFPKLPVPAPDAPSLVLPVDVLSMLIARTHFSISTDETRPHVNSGLVEIEPGKIRMVSTDGHRLTKMEIALPAITTRATMLIPLKAVMLLRGLLADQKGLAKGEPGAGPTLTMTQSGPNAFFQIGPLLFSVKLVDAAFPPYQQVVPTRWEREARVPRQRLADSLRAVSLAASDRTGGVKLTLASGTLRIVSESPESGNGFDEVPVDYNGGETTIGFNAKYFLDVLGALDDEEVQFGVSGELDPAVVRPSTEVSGQSYLAVLMPMRC